MQHIKLPQSCYDLISTGRFYDGLPRLQIKSDIYDWIVTNIPEVECINYENIHRPIIAYDSKHVIEGDKENIVAFKLRWL